jgi:polycomb protein EED
VFSVRWYNDIIISHAAREDVIQLWKIDGFDSEESPPDTAPIPASTAVNSLSRVSVAASSVPGTRSAWGGRFQRLLQFDLPDHVRFYVRFSLFHELGAHPVLVAGNEKSKMFFWDLQHVEGLGIGDNGAPDSKEKDKKVLPHHFRDGSVASTNSGTSGQHSRSTSAFTKGKGKASAAKPNRGVGDPFHSVPQNQDIMVQKYEFPFRQFAWSRDGQWCVGVGGYSMITVLHRWEHGVPPPETSVSRKAG